MKINVAKRDKRILLTQDALEGQSDVWELTPEEALQLWVDLSMSGAIAAEEHTRCANFYMPEIVSRG